MKRISNVVKRGFQVINYCITHNSSDCKNQYEWGTIYLLN